MADTLQQIISDPDFAKFPPDVQRAIIARVDSTFTQLGADDQSRVLARLGVGDVRSQIAERKANPPATAKGDPNAPTGVADTYFPAFAHPVSAVAGFARSLNPMPLVSDLPGTVGAEEQQRMDAFNRLRGGATGGLTDPETYRDAATYALPFLGGALANAGRSLSRAETNPQEAASGLGEAIGVTSGPAIAGRALGGLADLAQNSAVGRYAKIFGKKADPEIARAAAAQLLRDRIRSTNPQEDLANLGEQRATAGEAQLDTAIRNMPEPVRGAPVLDRITKARQDQYNIIGSAKDPSLIVKAAQDPANYAIIPTEGGDMIGALKGPDSGAMVNYLQKYAENVKSNMDRAGQITPQNALNLKRAYDVKPGARGMYSGKDVTSNDLQARATVAEAMRPELNADPAVGAANADINSALRLKELAKESPANKQIFTPWNLAELATGLGVMPFSHGAGGLFGTYAGLSILYKVLTSPAWRTSSAVLQSQVADLIRKGDYSGAAEIAVRASQPDTTKNSPQ